MEVKKARPEELIEELRGLKAVVIRHDLSWDYCEGASEGLGLMGFALRRDGPGERMLIWLQRDDGLYEVIEALRAEDIGGEFINCFAHPALRTGEERISVKDALRGGDIG